MELTGIWFIVPSGLLALIVLFEVMDDAIAALRRHSTPYDALASTAYSAGFTLRRPDSILRERYHRSPPRGRTTEICKDKFDPYDACP